MKLKIISWNVNSVRKRKEQIEDLINNEDPDIVMLQETKVDDSLFPDFNSIFSAYHGQKARNGVAILSKKPSVIISKSPLEARLIAIKYTNCVFINVYVPNGFSVSASMEMKMALSNKLKEFIKKLGKVPIVIGGDVNIAYEAKYFTCENPFDQIEIDCFKELESLFVDPSDNRQYITWWDYRANSFNRNIGMGIDRFFLSNHWSYKPTQVLKKYRNNDNPSDHAPIMIEINLKNIITI